MSDLDHLELRFEWITESGGWEIAVNGSLLRPRLTPRTDRMSAFSMLLGKDRDLYIARLLGEVPDSIPSGRTRLLMCSECGDFGCGAITMSVRRSEGRVEWTNFTDEADYEEYGVRPVVPSLVLRFDAAKLEKTIREPFK